jgi:hypothetical protein
MVTLLTPCLLVYDGCCIWQADCNGHGTMVSCGTALMSRRDDRTVELPGVEFPAGARQSPPPAPMLL